jgi:uncharacterized membrane protein YfcA
LNVTLDSYKSGLKTYRKEELWSCGFILFFIALASVPFGIIGSRVDRVGFDKWCVVLTTVTAVVFASGMFYSIARWPKKRMKALGLICPHCRKALAGFNSQVVIATGKCGFCGDKVLEDRRSNCPDA